MVADPENAAGQAACHSKQCSQQATYFCDRCAHPYCAEHIRQVVIERRQTRSNAGGLAHLPTSTESYWLCPSCWNKPVPDRQSQVML